MSEDTCIIIANGPSLRQVSNDWLAGYETIGTNRIFLRYVPTYYVACNELVVNQNATDITRMSELCRRTFGPAGKHASFTDPLSFWSRRTWTTNPKEPMYPGFSVTFLALELAYHIGYQTALLVGLDHRYQYSGPPNRMSYMTGDDPNHFDPGYFRGLYWHHPDLVRAAQDFDTARREWERDGRRIINLTPGSACEVFEMGDIGAW